MKICKSYLKSLTFFFCFFLINNNLFGQITNQKVPTVDDQRKIQQNPTLKKSPQEIFKEPVEDDQIKKEEMKIILKKINFDGNTIFTSEKLQEVVKNFINIEIDLKDVQNISKELSFFYKSQGYWANAVIPEQDIKNQELLVRIYEGKVGKFIIKKDEKDIPISEDKLLKYLQNNLEKDQVLRIDQLDSNLKIINSILNMYSSLKINKFKEEYKFVYNTCIDIKETIIIELKLIIKDAFSKTSSIDKDFINLIVNDDNYNYLNNNYQSVLDLLKYNTDIQAKVQFMVEILQVPISSILPILKKELFIKEDFTLI